MQYLMVPVAMLRSKHANASNSKGVAFLLSFNASTHLQQIV